MIINLKAYTLEIHINSCIYVYRNNYLFNNVLTWSLAKWLHVFLSLTRNYSSVKIHFLCFSFILKKYSCTKGPYIYFGNTFFPVLDSEITVNMN